MEGEEANVGPEPRAAGGSPSEPQRKAEGVRLGRAPHAAKRTVAPTLHRLQGTDAPRGSPIFKKSTLAATWRGIKASGEPELNTGKQYAAAPHVLPPWAFITARARSKREPPAFPVKHVPELTRA